ncbi:MAG TPA: pYEATS domain-containing protein [Pyrinomonadaceae bacterium]|nr:pYEATS domain-containing protein [Pyrinomonadaceae bacterium]
MEHINLVLKDTVFNPNVPPDEGNKVHVRMHDDTPYFQVWLYLEGDDLPWVRGVKWILDSSSFEEPERFVPRSPSNPNCQLRIWTWGRFPVHAEVQDKRGFSYVLKHQMRFQQELPEDNSRYEYEKEEFAPPERPTFKQAL